MELSCKEMHTCTPQGEQVRNRFFYIFYIFIFFLCKSPDTQSRKATSRCGLQLFFTRGRCHLHVLLGLKQGYPLSQSIRNLQDIGLGIIRPKPGHQRRKHCLQNFTEQVKSAAVLMGVGCNSTCMCGPTGRCSRVLIFLYRGHTSSTPTCKPLCCPHLYRGVVHLACMQGYFLH